MQYWLVKSEPSAYSFDDLIRDTKKVGGEEWDGIRNYQARNNMQKMNVGDRIFFYYTEGVREIVGIAKVVKQAHQDSTDKTGTWQCVDIAAVKWLPRSVSLAEVKALAPLKHMVLVTHGRLSVQPVKKSEWDKILELAGRKN